VQANETQTTKAKLATMLAGLEAGMVGVLWMLAWLGVSSMWQQRTFWAPENLMAPAFDRNATLAPVFSWSTCAGLAVYVVIYSLLGMLFAVLLGNRVPRKRVMPVAVVFGLAWYYFSFRWTFKSALPLVALLHVEHPTLVGHLLFGTILGRYPVYFDRLMRAAAPMVEDQQIPPAIEAPPSEAVAAEVIEKQNGPALDAQEPR
jgi:hypothetical protein